MTTYTATVFAHGRRVLVVNVTARNEYKAWKLAARAYLRTCDCKSTCVAINVKEA